MTDDGRASRSWLKLGGLGVLGVVGLLTLWAASLFGAAVFRARHEVIERRALSREIPGRRMAPLPLQAARPAAGKVVLDLSVGHFSVVPGEPGARVAVDAEFDRGSYALVESFEPADGDGWTYRVTFEETNWFKDGGLRALVGGSFPRIIVSLPPDVPLALEGSFGKGHANLELGGLWLTEIDIDFAKGALLVDIDRPLVAPAERLTIRSRQGGTFARSLGNASPRTLEIDSRMGGLTVDLGGTWVRDADVFIASRMGGARLRLPQGVFIEGLPGERLAAMPAQPPEVAPPTLRMTLSSPFGGLDVVGPRR